MTTTVRQPRLTAKQAARADAVINVLSRLWPNCFQVYQKRRRPLMVGIAEALLTQLEPAITGRINEQDIRHALARYTGAPGYLNNTIAGTERIDLSGKPVSVVTEQQAARARGIVKQRAQRQTNKNSVLSIDEKRLRRIGPTQPGM